MLIPIEQLSEDQLSELQTKLEHAVTDVNVKRAFYEGMSVEQWMHYDPHPTSAPSYHTITFVSLTDTVNGIFQAYIIQSEDYMFHCSDMSVLNLGDKRFAFGKDHKEFIEFLFQYCHRISATGLERPHIHHNPYEHVGSDARHLPGARRIGYREKYIKNANGEYCDQYIWETITPKGRALLG